MASVLKRDLAMGLDDTATEKRPRFLNPRLGLSQMMDLEVPFRFKAVAIVLSVAIVGLAMLLEIPIDFLLLAVPVAGIELVTLFDGLEAILLPALLACLLLPRLVAKYTRAPKDSRRTMTSDAQRSFVIEKPSLGHGGPSPLPSGLRTAEGYVARTEPIPSVASNRASKKTREEELRATRSVDLN